MFMYKTLNHVADEQCIKSRRGSVLDVYISIQHPGTAVGSRVGSSTVETSDLRMVLRGD